VEQMTAIYTFADDYLKAHPSVAHWRRSPNDHPAFTDAEVLTIALLQGCFGVSTLKQTYSLVACNYRDAFPRLPTYQQWLARLHALSGIVGQLTVSILETQDLPVQLYVMDAKPIPVCQPIRHGRVRLLRDEGARFGKTTKGWFFGFQLHVLVHHTGAIMAAVLLPASDDEHDAALALCWSVEGGVCLGDLGYRGEALREALLEEAQMLLLTPADARSKQEKRTLFGLRERIETSFSSLWRAFVDRVFSRSFRGLWNTIKLKILYFNLTHCRLLPA
jgi:hypothetical protein